MYNRYIRNDNGSYTRIPEEDRFHSTASPAGTQHNTTGSSSPFHGTEDNTGQSTSRARKLPDSFRDLLKKLTDRLHLDSGDLLLLALLYLLYREDADEELLAALALLLIL